MRTERLSRSPRPKAGGRRSPAASVSEITSRYKPATEESRPRSFKFIPHREGHACVSSKWTFLNFLGSISNLLWRSLFIPFVKISQIWAK